MPRLLEAATRRLALCTLAALLVVTGCVSAPDSLPRGPARQHYDRAVAFYAKGSYQSAIESYQLAVQARPAFTEAHFGLGVAFIKTEFFRGAVLALGRALELRNIYPEAHYNLGVSYHRLGRHVDAIRHFGIARSQQPDLPGVDFPLGQAYERLGRPDSARAAYQSALAHRLFDANIALAGLAREERDTTAYAAFLEAATAADSTKHEPWIELGAVYDQGQRLEEAAGAYKKALALKKDHPGLVVKLAGVLARSGEYARARDLYKLVVEQEPSNNRAFYNLGVMYDALGDGDHAVVAYREAVLISPDFSDAHLNLAIDLFEMQRFREALKSYEALLALEIHENRRKQVTQIVSQLKAALGKD